MEMDGQSDGQWPRTLIVISGVWSSDSWLCHIVYSYDLLIINFPVVQFNKKQIHLTISLKVSWQIFKIFSWISMNFI